MYGWLVYASLIIHTQASIGFYFVQNNNIWAGEMTRWVEALAAKPNDFVPSLEAMLEGEN